MKGIFFIPINKPSTPYSEVLNSIIDETIFCDKNLISEAFFGEHMADKYEKVSSSLTIISSLAKLTKKIKLSTMTSNIIFFHPAVLSSIISSVDNLCAGRLQLGIGCGSNQCDLELINKLDHNNHQIMLEMIDLVMKILKSKDLIDIKTKNFSISSKKKGSKKLLLGYFDGLYKNRKNLEIILPILSKKSYNLEICKEKKWSFLSSNFCSESIIKSHISNYNSKVSKENLSKMKIARFIFVTEKYSEVKKYLFAENSPYKFMINVIKKKMEFYNRNDVFGLGTTDLNEIINELVIYGTPDMVSEKLSEFKNRVGDFGTLVYTSVPSFNKDIYKNSLKLFANEVKFKKS